MTTLAEFIAKYDGRGIDFDGYYGDQCVDLAQQYSVEVVGAPRGSLAPGGNAVDVFTHFPAAFYTAVPNGASNVPPAGAIVIWGQNARVGTGPVGHIAVATGDGDADGFVSFDQNWGGTLCRLVTHSYDGVIGWLVPKTAAVAVPIAPAGHPPKDAATAVAALLRHAGALSKKPDVAGTSALVHIIKSTWPDKFDH